MSDCSASSAVVAAGGNPDNSEAVADAVGSPADSDADSTPTGSLHDIEVALVTGQSGAGRGTAAKVLEDLGYYVSDNMPPELVTRMVQIGRESTPPIERLAMVVDLRSRLFSGDLPTLKADLAEIGVTPRIVYLEASDEVLVRRFESVRRNHPLQHLHTGSVAERTLSEAIAEERGLLAPVKGVADLVIDTSSLSVHDLRRRMETAFGALDSGVVAVTVQSFGFKYGLPLDADAVCDMRFLPNPFWVPELRSATGQSPAVADYVLGAPGAREFLDGYHRLMLLTIDGYRREGKRYLTVAVGCTGGKHRSVAVSEALADMLRRSPGLSVRVRHRDMGRE